MVPVLAHERGVSASRIGALLGAFALAATVSRLAVPFVARRVPEWMLVTVAVTTAGALVAGYPFLPGVPTMAACSFALGLLLGSVQPSVLTLLHTVTPSQRHGDAMAMRLIMINASGISMPLLYGTAALWISSGGVFHAVGLVVGLAGGVAIRAVQRAQKSSVSIDSD